jgi:hypothetical protein
LGARTYIETHRRRRHSNRVLHGHPSPIFWQRGTVPVKEIMASREQSLRDVPKSLNLYVATPYWLPTNPDRCGFCLFPSEVYRGRGQLDTYLRYLEREAAMYRPFLAGTPLTSVYFGGGTSNLYAIQYGAHPDFHFQVSRDRFPGRYERGANVPRARGSDSDCKSLAASFARSSTTRRAGARGGRSQAGQHDRQGRTADRRRHGRLLFERHDPVDATALRRDDVERLDAATPPCRGRAGAERPARPSPGESSGYAIRPAMIPVRKTPSNVPAPPSIALSGYGQPEDRRRGADAGFDAYLVKPVDPEALLRALIDDEPTRGQLA